MAYYEAALREIENPISEDYTPMPNANMSLGILQRNLDALLTRDKYWVDKHAVSNSRERGNIDKILVILRAKQAAYRTAIATAQASIPTSPVDDLVNNPNNSGGNGGFTDTPTNTLPSTSTPPLVEDKPSVITKAVDAIKSVIPGATKTTTAPATPAATAASNKKTGLIVGLIALVVIVGTVVYVKRKK